MTQPSSTLPLSSQTGSPLREAKKKMHCPYCQTERTKRDGTTIKGFQRFFCYVCRRYWQDVYIRHSQKRLDQQKELLAWAKLHPLLAQHLIALPSGVYQHLTPVKYSEAITTQVVSDVLLAYPRAPYHGLWIELKDNPPSKEKLPASNLTGSEAQPQWMQAMQSVGYEVKVVHGWQEAAQKIAEYLAWN